jgi:hypothetical protein
MLAFCMLHHPDQLLNRLCLGHIFNIQLLTLMMRSPINLMRLFEIILSHNLQNLSLNIVSDYCPLLPIIYCLLIYCVISSLYEHVCVCCGAQARYRPITSSLSSSPLSFPRSPLPSNSKASRRTRTQSRFSDAAACMSR